MNLLTLYYFVELARELHVTNTAQKLYISQQNLSQHIQRLEQYYGVSLFHRKPKLALTYEGEQLYAVAVKILAEEHEFVNRLADISANSIGSLKLGIPTYRGEISLPSILPQFYEKWPNISIELCDKSSSEMEEMLCNGELDLFIGVMYQDNPKLDSTPLLNDHIYMVCSDHLLKKYYPDTWSVLKNRSERGTDLSAFPGLPFLLPHPRTWPQCAPAALYHSWGAFFLQPQRESAPMPNAALERFLISSVLACRSKPSRGVHGGTCQQPARRQLIRLPIP